MAGGLKVEGANQLRTLAVELKAADRALWLATTRQLRALARPAAAAVQAEERRVLPKRGGLNEWVAATPIGVRITTGTRSAGVRLVQSKKGRGKPHDLLAANDTGTIRHPVMGNRKVWVEQTGIPTGWWERPLLGMEPQAQAAMKAAMDEAARAAGFRGP